MSIYFGGNRVSWKDTFPVSEHRPSVPPEYTGDDTEIDYDFTISRYQWVKPIAHLNIALENGAQVRIDWGDGNVEQLTTKDQYTSTDHEYSVRGKYTVRIITDVPASNGYGFHSKYTKLLLNDNIYNNTTITLKQLEAVAFVTAIRLGPRGYVYYIAGFMPCLEIIQLNVHEGLSIGSNTSYPIVGTSPKYVTYGNTGLICGTVTGQDLLAVRFNNMNNFNQGNKYAKLFASCSSLSYVQDDLDVSTGTSFYGTFFGCHQLQSVPEVLDVSKGTDFESMFNSCYRLQAVPEVLDVSKGTNFNLMFNACYRLQSVPEVLDVSKGTNFKSMFNACYRLQSVPEVLDVSKGTNFNSMFSNCRMLVQIPEVINISNGTTCDSMFYACLVLKSVPLVIDGSKCTNFSSMFVGCGTQNIPLIFIVNKDLTTNQTIDFSSCNRILPESVAVFDSDGNIIDGFAAFKTVPDTYGILEKHCPDYYKDDSGNWLPHASAGKSSDATGAKAVWSIKFPKVVYTSFNETQILAIEQACTSHGWTVIWTK